ncbi:altered inheritance of mitochondria protein 13 [Geosmithia morbida]|uniref:Altered inheritance of mitochondria protein 13 n=1 Tax=Geosmithia morbida TaxID=1094350 RepID=A0A9P4YWM1_9HYPO|nr:altered inheritance of mitochondria protein 13 [Geosmithia morbida]KAF4124446.1 altered inheritance of mitochondria protein 13 [Geosmithia morbida]
MGASESKVSQSHTFKARLIEAQIQARVAKELKALEKKQDEALAAAREKLASISETDSNNSGEMTGSVVGKQLDQLRAQLEARKQIRDLPKEVEGARGEMVRCLTENDRRPLDCYNEVEKFKAEVRKMEREWVNKVTA